MPSVRRVWRGLTGLTLAVLDEMPILGLPLKASATFQGTSIWLVGAVVWTTWALGLRRLDRSATRMEEEAETGVQAATERLKEGFLASLTRLDSTGELVSGSPTHEVASAFAGALVEAVDSRDRRAFARSALC